MSEERHIQLPKPTLPPEDFPQPAVPNVTVNLGENHHSGNHHMGWRGRAAILGSLGLAGGVAWVLINPPVEFNENREAEAASPDTLIEEVTLEGDLNFLDVVYDADSVMGGYDEWCVDVWGFEEKCAPNTFYSTTTSIENGVVNVIAPEGSIDLTADTDMEGNPYPIAVVEIDQLRAEPFYPKQPNPRSDSVGWNALEDVFTENDELEEYEDVALQYASDTATQSALEAVTSQGTVIDAGLVHALRGQIENAAGLLESENPEGAATLREMASEETVFVIDHQNQAIDFETQQTYVPGSTKKIGEVTFTFQEPKPAQLDGKSAAQIAEYSRDKSFKVVNSPESTADRPR